MGLHPHWQDDGAPRRRNLPPTPHSDPPQAGRWCSDVPGPGDNQVLRNEFTQPFLSFRLSTPRSPIYHSTDTSLILSAKESLPPRRMMFLRLKWLEDGCKGLKASEFHKESSKINFILAFTFQIMGSIYDLVNQTRIYSFDPLKAVIEVCEVWELAPIQQGSVCWLLIPIFLLFVSPQEVLLRVPISLLQPQKEWQAEGRKFFVSNVLPKYMSFVESWMARINSGLVVAGKLAASLLLQVTFGFNKESISWRSSLWCSYFHFCRFCVGKKATYVDVVLRVYMQVCGVDLWVVSQFRTWKILFQSSLLRVWRFIVSHT